MLRGEGGKGVWIGFLVARVREEKGRAWNYMGIQTALQGMVRRGRVLKEHETLWDSRRAISEGQVWAGQLMAGGSEVSASVCSGEGKVEPVPLWAGAVGGEQNSTWLWDSPVLVPVTPSWLLVCAGGKLVLCMDPAVPSEGELKLPTALVLHLSVFRFFFHLCLLMLFHLWYRLNLRPTTPPSLHLILNSYLYLCW